MKPCKPPKLSVLFSGTLVCMLWLLCGAAHAQLPSWDFTTSTGRTGWSAFQHMSLSSNAEGFVASISGSDPIMLGPVKNYPAGTNLWLRLRIKSVQNGICQVFWFPSGGGSTEANSFKFFIPGGNQWFTARVPVPALGANYQLRLDPPGLAGNVATLSSLWFEQRYLVSTPTWPVPHIPAVSPGDVMISSGELTLRHNAAQLGGFEVSANGMSMAVGNTNTLVGYLMGSQTRWLALTNSATIQPFGNGIQVATSVSDIDGGTWQFEQTFVPTNGAFAVETAVTVNRDRNVVYLPGLTLLSGIGTFGTNKTQGLFPGVEYLENESSSSQLDMTNQWQRLVPDTEKITIPLLAICASNRYIGLIWQTNTNVCAAFDSPDRQFNSGGHLMSVLFPGSDSVNRAEGSLLPYGEELFRSNQTYIFRTTIVGGSANSVVAALQKYVELNPLPPVPAPPMSASAYFDLAAQGWLNTAIRSGDFYRADLSSGPQPAADAALWMKWLATKVTDPTTVSQLNTAAQGAIAQVPSSQYNFDSTDGEPPLIGHVRYPAQSLVFSSRASDVITGYEPYYLMDYLRDYVFQGDGSVPYSTNLVPNSSGIDYAKTHWSREASGFASKYVALYLDALSCYGDFSSSYNYRLNYALTYLNSLDKFRNGVPRGAQSWEVPLHAPDLLGAAYLVRAYTLAYEITQNPDYLEQARHWAWTGVAFVYLVQPTPQPFGLYNTVPVLGATMWVLPWMGLPVQWCGLVYADAISRLNKYDSNGPWKRLADGITVGGLQHTFPAMDATAKGLLPDSFPLRLQYRDGSRINPIDVMSGSVRYFTGDEVFDSRGFLHHGTFLQAPGKITVLSETQSGFSFRVDGWPTQPYYIVLTRLWRAPTVRVNGAPLSITYPQHEYVGPDYDGRLTLQLPAGTNTVEIVYPAVDAVTLQPTNGLLKISWSDLKTNLTLQAADALSGTNWLDVNQTPQHANGTFSVNQAVSGQMQFYRLRR